MPPEAFFLPTPQGQRFCIFHAVKANDLRGLVLYIHPFAEEMNKARRMAALQSRALAEAGFAVLQLDLHGCGDSAGDFGDAHWDGWVRDIVLATDWLRKQMVARHGGAPTVPLWLWGLRVGCLLAVQAARQLDTSCHFLFWQPTYFGSLALQQFLRLRLALDLREGQPQDAREIMARLRHTLACGTPVEIAGYWLAPELASGLEAAVLTPPPGAGRVEWLEVTPASPPRLQGLPNDALGMWQQAGFRLRRLALQGPAFWQSSEIEEAPALLAATRAALCSEALDPQPATV